MIFFSFKLPELISSLKIMTLFISFFSLVHFRGITYALNALWRTLTGEDWYQFLWDAGVSLVLNLTRDTIVDILIVRWGSLIAKNR